MMEVLSESVRLVNLPFTVLLGCVIGYWLLMGLGLVHFETGTDADLQADLDSDVDVDAHADVDVDAHADMDVDAHAEVEAGADAHVDGDADADGHLDTHVEPGLFSALFQFLNIGEVPLMVILSLMALSLWTFSLIFNHYWNHGSVLRGLLFLAPNLVATCLVTHLVSKPFKLLFKALNREYEQHVPIVGRTCVVTTSEANAQFGQAQIETKGAPLLINVRTNEDAVLKKGETGLVIKEDKAKSVYTIIKVTADKLET
jgi:hypothetical protein